MEAIRIECGVCGKQFPPSRAQRKSAAKYRRGAVPVCSKECWKKTNANRQIKSVAERFWGKVVKTDGCWTWAGARRIGKWNYGQLLISGGGRRRPVSAHRISWEIHFGPIPPGMCVCHCCDNPPCIRPDHLFLGTLSDNSLDMYKKGRKDTSWIRGSTHPTSRLTEDNVISIRASSEDSKVLAERYGVTRNHIWALKRGDRWGWLSRSDDSYARTTADRAIAGATMEDVNDAP